MLDIVDYLNDYPEKFHHPREDIAFSRLVDRDPMLGGTIDHLLHEHRIVATAGTALRSLLSTLLDGSFIARDTVMSTAHLYLGYYRQHIGAEESAVLPAAAQLLTPADWQAVERAVPARVDRLFGDDLDARYRELRQQLFQPPADPRP
jgi:hemerythrin-like domain-containing protein